MGREIGVVFAEALECDEPPALPVTLLLPPPVLGVMRGLPPVKAWLGTPALDLSVLPPPLLLLALIVRPWTPPPAAALAFAGSVPLR